MIGLVLVLIGCKGPAVEEQAPFERVGTLHGSAAAGYGHSLAYSDGQLLVGAPLGADGGAVYVGEELRLRGQGRDFLGSALAGGAEALIAAPRWDDGRGAVLALDGSERLSGVVGEGLGSKPTWHEGSIAAIHISGVRAGQTGGWSDHKRLWSLVSGDFDGDGSSTLVAGRVDGSLSVAAQSPLDGLGPSSELGYALAACDLDDDGADELVIGVPGRSEVHIHDGPISSLDLSSPTVVLRLGHSRGGHAVACRGSGLLVGAPGRSAGRVYWFDDPLDTSEPELILGEESATPGLGWALAVRLGEAGPEGFAISANAAGEVWLFDAARPRR